MKALKSSRSLDGWTPPKDYVLPREAEDSLRYILRRLKNGDRAAVCPAAPAGLGERHSFNCAMFFARIEVDPQNRENYPQCYCSHPKGWNHPCFKYSTSYLIRRVQWILNTYGKGETQ